MLIYDLHYLNEIMFFIRNKILKKRIDKKIQIKKLEYPIFLNILIFLLLI